MSGKLEQLLCKIHQQSHCHLVGNATTGLWLALAALGLRGKRIAIPNSVCLNVPLAVLLSGNTPAYIDVTLRDFGIDIGELIKKGDQIDAVIAVHAYGSVCNIQEIAAYCKSLGIPLIEDLAVAQGASLDGQPVGSFSDIAVVSFGAGKIIDVGHGGAVMTSRLSLMNELVAREALLDVQSSSSQDAVSAFGQYHTDLYNRHYGSGINVFSTAFKICALELRQHILCRFDRVYGLMIEERLEKLDAIVLLRQAKAEMLESLLTSFESASMEIFRPPAGSVYWRFNVLIERRDALLKSLLAKKIRISSWFPSADLFFDDRAVSRMNTPVSDYVGDRVLNLWVNEDVGSEYIETVASELADHVTVGNTCLRDYDSDGRKQ
ncbi:MAG: DegT/DnrJ/EryC1/StrS family aminotransferase [Methylovulum sp.]|nr:DegT/DnrJ/EryC1/StrS family aminotransferase [Methylovulum sp.]